MTGGTDCFVTGGTECFVTGGAECFVSTDFLAVPSACCCPSPPHVPLHSCKWSNTVPMSIFSATCLGITIAQGITAT